MSDQYTECDKEKIISQWLKVQAQITITPLVQHGNPKVYCIESNIKPLSDCNSCDCNCCNSCDCNYYNSCDCNCGNSYNCNCGNCNCGNACDYDCYNCCDWGSNYNVACQSERPKPKCNFTLTQVICVEIPISIDADVDIDEGIVCCGKPDFK